MWAEENSQLEVTLTSAVELDPEIVERVGEEIERQTDRKVQLSSQVDEDLLGGLVLQVGNMVLDASIRNRLEKTEKGGRPGRVGPERPPTRRKPTRWRSSPTR